MLDRGSDYHRTIGEARGSNLEAGSAKIYTGMVTAVYRPDDPDAINSPLRRGNLAALTHRGILCDVLVIDTHARGFLRQVPIMSEVSGVSDDDSWEPRAASIHVGKEGGMRLEGGAPSDPRVQTTPSFEADGDVVIVTFLGGDLQRPIIIGQLKHAKSLHPESVNDEPRHKRRKIIRGNIFRINANGQVVLDLSGQTNGEIADETGKEVASANPTLTVTGSKATITGDNSGVDIALQEGATVTIDGGGDGQTSLEVGGSQTAATQQGVLLGQTLGDLMSVIEQIAVAAFLPLAPPPSLVAQIELLKNGSDVAGQSYTSLSLETD